MHPRSSTRVATAVAALLLAGAMLSNPWVLTAFTPLRLDRADACAVGLLAGSLAVAGAVLFWRRSNPARRRGVYLALSSVALTLVLAESALRLLGFGSRELPIFRENPSGAGSYRLRPGLNVATSFHGRPCTIDTNSHGMRWREVSREPRSGTTRIAVLGDSFTFGLWARDVEHSFPAVFESGLGTDRFEVLGFGVPGYGLLDEELLLREEVASFSPSHVVVAVYVGNDFMDTHLGLDRTTVNADGVYGVADEVVAERVPAEFRPPVTGLSTRLWRSLRLVQAFRNSWLALAPGATAPADGASADVLDSRPTAGVDSFWSLREYPAFAVDAERATIAAIERIHTFTTSHDARLAIVAIPYKEQVVAPERFGPEFDRGRPQRALRAAAERLAVPFLDLEPGLSASRRATGRPGYWLDDGHFDDDGHRVAGELLAEFFRTEVLTGWNGLSVLPPEGK